MVALVVGIALAVEPDTKGSAGIAWSAPAAGSGVVLISPPLGVFRLEAGFGGGFGLRSRGDVFGVLDAHSVLRAEPVTFTFGSPPAPEPSSDVTRRHDDRPPLALSPYVGVGGFYASSSDGASDRGALVTGGLEVRFRRTHLFVEALTESSELRTGMGPRVGVTFEW